MNRNKDCKNKRKIQFKIKMFRKIIKKKKI